jgi:hypothetical protein
MAGRDGTTGPDKTIGGDRWTTLTTDGQRTVAAVSSQETVTSPDRTTGRGRMAAATWTPGGESRQSWERQNDRLRQTMIGAEYDR